MAASSSARRALGFKSSLVSSAKILKTPVRKIARANHIAFIHEILATPACGQVRSDEVTTRWKIGIPACLGRRASCPSMITHCDKLEACRPSQAGSLTCVKDRTGRLTGNKATLRRHGRQKEDNESRFARGDFATRSGAEVSATG